MQEPNSYRVQKLPVIKKITGSFVMSGFGPVVQYYKSKGDIIKHPYIKSVKNS